jgi:hypothetical protein
MWNHRIHYMGRAFAFKYDSWLVDGAGQKLLTSTAQSTWEFPIFEPKRTQAIRMEEPYFQWRVDYTGPQRRAGEALLLIEPVDLVRSPRLTWFYVPGQRRAKQIEFPDDALHSSSSGAYTNDDAFVYTGMLERYDLKLLGKREMLVPYNTYRFTYHTRAEDLLLPGHVNPDYLRWELHRVWVVEATLKAGKRHIYHKRTFYLDEDSWMAVASDQYDARGQLYRGVYAYSAFAYDSQSIGASLQIGYDLIAGIWMSQGNCGLYYGIEHRGPFPARDWQPDSLAGAGIR